VRSGRDVDAARERTIEVPLDIVRSAAEVVGLADQLASHGNPNLRADAVVAAILATAAAESAAMLIAVNVEDKDDVRLLEAQKLARSLRRSAS
jgi:formiminotetrahydrofolate cyclodeaminase